MNGWILLAALAGVPAVSATPAPSGADVPAIPALGPLPAPAAGGKSWTLAEVLKAAEEHQPDVRDARLKAAEARADRLTAGLRPNPSLQLGLTNVPLKKPVGSSWSDVLVWGAGLSQDFELGGKRSKREASAEAGIQGADASARDASRTSRFEVQKAFLQALWAEERQRIAAESLARYLDSVRLIRARFEAGEDAGADVNKIELEKQRYATEARESARSAVEARAELFRLVGLPGQPDADRVDGSFLKAAAPASVDPLIAEALEKRPDLLALRAALDKAQKDLELARAQAVPDVNLGLSYAYSPSEVPSGAQHTVGLTATVPLPIFNRNQGEVQKAELEVERAQLALQRARADAEREVRLAAGHLASADQAVDELEKNYLGRADQALKTAERSYREGKASLLEVLEAQRTYLETRAGYVDALLDRAVGGLELARAVGTEVSP